MAQTIDTSLIEEATTSIPDLINQELDANAITASSTRQRLLDIAYCESNNTQFNADGSLYRGEIDHDDTGIYQINERYNPYNMALNMGFDYYTAKGNVDYAIKMYGWRGSAPWSASKKCWLRSPAHW